MATVVLERGHHGRSWHDHGAVRGDLREDVLVRDYLVVAENELLRLGHRPVIQSAHPARGYRERLARADKYKPVLYVACHCNAAEPGIPDDYGLVVHDKRSWRGKRAATLIGNALLPRCPELRRVLVQPDEPNWPRAKNVIRPIRAVAVVYEPGFISNPRHAALWTPEGLQRVGVALATGIDAYIRSR